MQIEIRNGRVIDPKFAVDRENTSVFIVDRKIAALDEPFAPTKPAAILSANMGCIVHLQNGTEVPVMHWVELLDQSLTSR